MTLKNDDPYVIVRSWPQRNPNTAIVVAEEKPNLIGGKYSLLEAVRLEKIYHSDGHQTERLLPHLISLLEKDRWKSNMQMHGQQFISYGDPTLLHVPHFRWERKLNMEFMVQNQIPIFQADTENENGATFKSIKDMESWIKSRNQLRIRKLRDSEFVIENKSNSRVENIYLEKRGGRDSKRNLTESIFEVREILPGQSVKILL